MLSKINRRHFFNAALAATALTALPRMGWALDDARARTLVDEVVVNINRVIASGKPLSGMIKDFERIFNTYADVNIIARSTLGADANRVSAAQMRAFTDAFRGYIARKYGKRFNEFAGGRIEVNSVKPVKSWHEVKSTAYLRGQSPFEVTFFVGEKSGRFYNMYIEGVNMLLTERTEIGAMLDRRRGDLDAMIRDLAQAG